MGTATYRSNNEPASSTNDGGTPLSDNPDMMRQMAEDRLDDKGEADWSTVPQEERIEIALKIIAKEADQLAASRYVATPLAKNLFKIYLEDAAEALGEKLTDTLLEGAVGAFMDGGVAALQGEGLLNILTTAGIGAEVELGLASALPIVGWAILIGATAWEISKEINEEAEKKEKQEKFELNGGHYLNADDTLDSDTKPVGSRVGYHWEQVKTPGQGQIINGTLIPARPGEDFKDGKFTKRWIQVRNTKFDITKGGYVPTDLNDDLDEMRQNEENKHQLAVFKYLAGVGHELETTDPQYLLHANFGTSLDEEAANGMLPVYDNIQAPPGGSQYTPTYSSGKDKPVPVDRNVYETMLHLGYEDLKNPATHMLNPDYGKKHKYNLYNPYPEWTRSTIYDRFHVPADKKAAKKGNSPATGDDDDEKPDYTPSHLSVGYNHNVNVAAMATPTGSSGSVVYPWPGLGGGSDTKAASSLRPGVGGGAGATQAKSSPAPVKPQADVMSPEVRKMLGLDFSGAAGIPALQPAAGTTPAVNSGWYNQSAAGMPVQHNSGGSKSASLPGINAPAAKSQNGKGNAQAQTHAQNHTHHAHTKSHAHSILPKDHITGQHPVTYNITIKEMIGQKIGAQKVHGTTGHAKMTGEELAKHLNSVVKSSRPHK